MTKERNSEKAWYVLRDLRRSNAKVRAYEMLSEEDFEVYTPMKRVTAKINGRKAVAEFPFIPDLVLVHSCYDELRTMVDKIPLLQFRFVKGGSGMPLTVGDFEMERFIHATNDAATVEYYAPGEIKPGMIGKKVRITGGRLAGEEMTLLKRQGSRKKRAIVELPNLCTAVVELKEECFV